MNAEEEATRPPEANNGLAVRAAELNSGALVLEKLQDLRRQTFTDADAFLFLTRREQALFVGYLRDQGTSTITIGQRYNLSLRDLFALLAEEDAHIGDLVRRTSIDSVIGRLFVAYDKTVTELEKKGRWEAYWRTNREFVKDLQHLGVIHESPRQIEMHHTHQLDDAQAAELARLRDLDDKRNRRLLEIRQAQDDAIDPLPLLGTTDPEPTTSP